MNKHRGRVSTRLNVANLKKIGDGIEADCIADDGYTWDYYFWNKPFNEALMAKGFCPMHCRLIYIFGNLTDIGHKCKMENLFNSVNLASAAYSLPQKVKIHGIEEIIHFAFMPNICQVSKHVDETTVHGTKSFCHQCFINRLVLKIEVPSVPIINDVIRLNSISNSFQFATLSLVLALPLHLACLLIY